MARLILLNKPYDVLSQFTDKGLAGGHDGGADGARAPRRTLSDFVDIPGVYPAGRLDRDSEGLLLLTDDGKLQARISQPRTKVEKTYLAQVERIPDEAALKALREGVELKDGRTAPARVRLIDPPRVWDRNPPIRHRKSVPDCWIELVISEGRNRQVRRMTAAVGHPTLRLIRSRIGPWDLGGLQPGEWREGEVRWDIGQSAKGGGGKAVKGAARRGSAAGKPASGKGSAARKSRRKSP